MFLFDPITCEKTKIDYKTLSGITGHSENDLRKYKSQGMKLRRIECYLLDDDCGASELRYYMEKESPDDEIWRRIEGTDKEISSYGRARTITDEGYRFCVAQGQGKQIIIYFSIDGKMKAMNRARLVAKYFLDMPNDSKNVVIHKDDNRWNDRVENLECVTRKKLAEYGRQGNTTPVIKVDPYTNKPLERYESVASASRKSYISVSRIWEVLNKKDEIAGGFKWIRCNGEMECLI